ncbi:tetratricopeptide repeat protein [Thermoflexibacter ruber]|uniref:Tetratricopeptide (TPR) repeat n=1 Tax=Thermoflexibacter ruber TaxID=1003 RepID=A0A1I2DPG7_9BACT|nr:tetratricopeptide repeat protein [Thermoflexibacter ruber]SFE82368.1 Tetratricopeptide (TPR) repeat [Thermoflexibacter ruber]
MWRSPYIFLIGILILICTVYYPSLDRDIIYWSGGRNLSNLATIPWLNLAFHLVNTLVVYFFVSTLLRNFWVGLAVTLFWGIHPLHADILSATARQGNLLFYGFYLLSLLFYLLYLRFIGTRWLLYGISLLCFGIAAYLQPLAWITPLVFFLLDYFEHRKWERQSYIDKLPFVGLLILSLFIGINTAPSYFTNLVPSTFQKLWLGGYALGVYVSKFFVPLYWNIINPLTLDKSILLIGALVVASCVGLIAFLFIRRRTLLVHRNTVFALLFFLLHILPTLVVPVDGYLMWVAYKSYVSYVGLSLFVVALYQLLFRQADKKMSLALVIIPCLVLAYVSYQRTIEWQSTKKLLTDVIEEYPNDELAYYLRGNIFLSEKNYEEAFKDLDKANLLRPDALTTFQLAHVLNKLNDFETSIKGYEMAVKMQPSLENTFRYYLDMAFNNAYIYNAPKARELFAKAEPLATTNELKAEWYLYYAMYYIRYLEFDKAIEHCEKALSLNPVLADAYTNLGTVKLYQGKLDEAVAYLKKADALKPNDKIILGNLAVCYRDKKDTLMANYYAQKYQLLTGKDK